MERTRDQRARILVIDDSPVYGRIVADSIARTPESSVVGIAGDAHTAEYLLREVRPAAVLLGVHLPHTFCLETLGRLLAARPIPVVVAAPDNPIGADLTLEALQRGALDFVVRPQHPDACDFRLRDDLRGTLRTALSSDFESLIRARLKRVATRSQLAADFSGIPAAERPPSVAMCSGSLIVIGAGAGGPPALLQIFEQLRPPLPPIVIAQHLPPGFTRALARRLNGSSQIRCQLAEMGNRLLPGHAYLAPGDRHLVVQRPGPQATLLVREGEPVSGALPSIDVLMQSAAITYRSRCLGVLLTGLGRDGVQGCRAIGAAGGFVIGQDSGSSYAYGMNRQAHLDGFVDRQFQLDDAAAAITGISRLLGRPEITIARSPPIADERLAGCSV